jgi:activator of HSP90 ATPase
MSVLRTVFNRQRIQCATARHKTITEEGMMRKVIRQSITIKARPHEVFEMLMDSEKHSLLTGHKVYISRRIGGRVETNDESIVGQNLELVTDRKIVQTWRDNRWPKEYHTKVTFLLDQHDGETRLTFVQTGVPEEDYESLKLSWYENYWKPLKALLERSEPAHRTTRPKSGQKKKL